MERTEDGDISIGFEGFPWHTHPESLEGWSGSDGTIEGFVQGLVSGRFVIAIVRIAGIARDAWVSLNPGADQKRIDEGESLEFRFWNGTVIRP